MSELPKHEQIKKELAEKFTVNSNYLGSFVKQTIMQTNFKELKEMNRPTEIRKGDVITNYEGVKSRPCVVVKVLKDRTVLYIPLTSSENVHCLSNSKSRFFGEGCFTKSFSVSPPQLTLSPKQPLKLIANKPNNEIFIKLFFIYFLFNNKKN